MMESLCLITEDKALMVRFIDWINAVPSGDDTTKLYVTSVDVQAEIERLQKELSECQATAREIHRQMCMQWGVMTLANQNSRRWPWLEEAATKAEEGKDE